MCTGTLVSAVLLLMGCVPGGDSPRPVPADPTPRGQGAPLADGPGSAGSELDTANTRAGDPGSGSVGDSSTQSADVSATEYFSDYFVFVSAGDPADSLVIPLDVNWERRRDGAFFVELKAWRGTATTWPMLYYVDELELASSPKLWSELPSVGGFEFQRDSIVAAAPDIGRLQLALPPRSARATQESTRGAGSHREVESRIDFDLGLTEVSDNSRRRRGWLLREKVRLAQRIKDSDAPHFSRFFWFVCSAGESFYLIKQHGAEQFAVQWNAAPNALQASPPGLVESPRQLSSFNFRILENQPDLNSRREQVPQQFLIQLREWDLELRLQTVAHHSGTGPQRESGKALYRQATVIGTLKRSTEDPIPTHGMLELILED